MKIGYIGVGEKPRIIDIQPDWRGSYYSAMRDLVGGPIEYFTPLYGDSPALIVNDEGMYTCPPNRAVYANTRMEQMGYLDMMTYSHPVKEGELYGILYGPILAVCHECDEEGNEVLRDLSFDEFTRLSQDFFNANSAVEELLFRHLAQFLHPMDEE